MDVRDCENTHLFRLFLTICRRAIWMPKPPQRPGFSDSPIPCQAQGCRVGLRQLQSCARTTGLLRVDRKDSHNCIALPCAPRTWAPPDRLTPDSPPPSRERAFLRLQVPQCLTTFTAADGGSLVHEPATVDPSIRTGVAPRMGSLQPEDTHDLPRPRDHRSPSTQLPDDPGEGLHGHHHDPFPQVT